MINTKNNVIRFGSRYEAHSNDFTYIDNVIQMNHLSTTTNKATNRQVFNTAEVDRTSLIELIQYLKGFDPKIAKVEIVHGPNRAGDIPHSLASVEKAKVLLGYEPTHWIEERLKEAVEWYWGCMN